MTGTADTEAYEFQEIYNLDVVVIPTNKPMIRKDAADQVYLTQSDKYEAVIADVRDCIARKQPVLVVNCIHRGFRSFKPIDAKS